MSLPFGDLNWLAVVVAALGGVVFGLEYSSGLFRKVLEDVQGVNVREVIKDPLFWILRLVVQVAAAIMLGLVFAAAGVSTVGGAIVWALLIGIGFIALHVVTDNHTLKKPFILTVFYGVGRPLQLVVIAIILSVWP